MNEQKSGVRVTRLCVRLISVKYWHVIKVLYDCVFMTIYIYNSYVHHSGRN